MRYPKSLVIDLGLDLIEFSESDVSFLGLMFIIIELKDSNQSIGYNNIDIYDIGQIAIGDLETTNNDKR